MIRDGIGKFQFLTRGGVYRQPPTVETLRRFDSLYERVGREPTVMQLVQNGGHRRYGVEKLVEES